MAFNIIYFHYCCYHCHFITPTLLYYIDYQILPLRHCPSLITLLFSLLRHAIAWWCLFIVLPYRHFVFAISHITPLLTLTPYYYILRHYFAIIAITYYLRHITFHYAITFAIFTPFSLSCWVVTLPLSYYYISDADIIGTLVIAITGLRWIRHCHFHDTLHIAITPYAYYD